MNLFRRGYEISHKIRRIGYCLDPSCGYLLLMPYLHSLPQIFLCGREALFVAIHYVKGIVVFVIRVYAVGSKTSTESVSPLVHTAYGLDDNITIYLSTLSAD